MGESDGGTVTVGNMSDITNFSKPIGLSEYASDADLAKVVLFKDYPEVLLTFASISCILFMLVGIPGNLITIIALARCKKVTTPILLYCFFKLICVRNATAIFIINLSCSDLLFCCFVLPLAVSTFWKGSWPHGKILCVMFPFARYALVAVSIFTVLAITINRYIMMSHPILYPKLYKKKYIALIIAAIWLFSFGVIIPTCLEQWGRFGLDTVISSCTIIADKQDRSPKKFFFIVAFVLPSIAIIVCYARILWIVRETARKSHTSGQFSVSVEKSLDLEGKRQSRRPQSPLNCFLNPGAELSSSCDSYTPEEQDRKPTYTEEKTRALRNETARNFRQSFIATIRWTTTPKQPRLPTKKDKKLLTMIVAIMVSFFVCHLPITLVKTIFQKFDSHPIFNVVGYVLMYFTTCINPVIYVVMSNEYRKAYRNVFKCRR